MASEALPTQRPPVWVAVTRRAIMRKPEKSSGDRDVLASGNFGILDTRREMTFPALDPPVLPDKVEAGCMMVKCLFVPADQCKFPSVVLLVTLNARLRPQGRVIPPLIPDPPLQLNMTGETTPVLNRLPEGVTGRALPQPL